MTTNHNYKSIKLAFVLGKVLEGEGISFKTSSAKLLFLSRDSVLRSNAELSRKITFTMFGIFKVLRSVKHF